MTRCPSQSVAALGFPIDDMELIPINKIKIRATTYTQKFSNMVTTCTKACLDVPGNSGWTRELNLGSSCSKQLA